MSSESTCWRDTSNTNPSFEVGSHGVKCIYLWYPFVHRHKYALRQYWFGSDHLLHLRWGLAEEQSSPFSKGLKSGGQGKPCRFFAMSLAIAQRSLSSLYGQLQIPPIFHCRSLGWTPHSLWSLLLTNNLIESSRLFHGLDLEWHGRFWWGRIGGGWCCLLSALRTDAIED